MISKNPLKGKNVSYHKVNYATFKNGINTGYDPYLTPITYSKNTYNYNFKNGALKTGLGIDALFLPKYKDKVHLTREITMPVGVEAESCWIYERFSTINKEKLYEVMLYGTNKKLYWMSLIGTATIFDELYILQKSPNYINYKLNSVDSLIMTNDTDGMHVFSYPTKIYKVENAPNITSMCLHYERLFATVGGDKSEVWFSDDLDPTNWNISLQEGGFISMSDERGAVNKVVSFKDYVYVFRDYGIARITAFSKQTEFNVSQLFVSSSKIYPKTVCVCGDRIMFLATDGMYVFDGSTTSKIQLNIDNLFLNISNDYATASYYNGKYYLACNLLFPGVQNVGCEMARYKNNTLLEIDVKTGELSILRGVDIIYMHTIKTETYSNLLCCVKDNETFKYKLGLLSNSGKIFNQPTRKNWESPLSDFGYPNKDKMIRAIYVVNKYPFTLTVRTEHEIKTFNVNTTSGVSTIRPYVKGKLLGLDFYTKNAQAEISNPQVVIGVL